jgi:hypothetical protein
MPILRPVLGEACSGVAMGGANSHWSRALPALVWVRVEKNFAAAGTLALLTPILYYRQFS